VLAVAAVGAAAAAFAPGALGAGAVLADRDVRSGSVGATAAQVAAARQLGAAVRWNRFGTPASLLNRGGYLARDVQGGSAVAVAREFLGANRKLFRLTSRGLAQLELLRDARLGASHAVVFRQTFEGLPAAEGGLLTVGVRGDRIAYASSSLSGETTLAAQPSLTPAQAWTVAARDVGGAA
jgi:hypothetical protein